MVKLSLLLFLGVLLLSCGGRGHSLPDTSNENAVGKSLNPQIFDAVEKSPLNDDENKVADDTGLGPVAILADSEEDRSDERVDEDKENDDIVDDFAKIPFTDVSDDDLEVLLALDDEIFMREADEHEAVRLLLKEHQSLHAPSKPGLRRRKRFIGGLLAGILRGAVAVGRVGGTVARVGGTVARVGGTAVGRVGGAVGRVGGRAISTGSNVFNSAARNFFRGISRSGVTHSGRRITQHYTRTGDYSRALRDFRGFQLNNVKPIGGGRISGQTGTMGNYRFTVRNGSSARSGNRPTMEVRSHDGTLVRKVRYD